jgi:hypothetical protein
MLAARERAKELVRARTEKLYKKAKEDAQQDLAEKLLRKEAERKKKAEEAKIEADAAARQRADQKAQHQALIRMMALRNCQVNNTEVERQLEQELCSLQDCLSKGEYLSDSMSRNLGVESVHVAVFGDYREGKSQFINNVLCGFIKDYKAFTDFRDSDVQVTKEVTCYSSANFYDSTAANLPVSLLDLFGIERDGSNWNGMLAPVLKGCFNGVEDTRSEKVIQDIDLKTDVLVRLMNQDRTRPDYTKMTYGLMLMVNGKKVANQCDMDSAYLQRLTQLAKVLESVSVPYDLVVIVSHMDEVEDSFIGKPGFTLSDMAEDLVWDQVQQVVAQATGVLAESIYPVLPVQKEDDKMEMVMSLRPLVHLLEHKIDRAVQWALQDKARYERETQPLELCFIDHATDEGDLQEITVEPDPVSDSLVKHRSVACVKQQIAELLTVNASTITRLEYRKDGEKEWIVLKDDDNLDTLGIRGEDTLRVMRSE